MIEKEIKILLSKEQYEKIEKVFSWKKKFTQINFYYGDLEKIDENGELTVRVRQNGDNYKLQIKKPVVYDEALHIKYKKYQKMEKSKYEVRVSYDKDHTLAAASLNLHGTAFTSPFHIKVKGVDNPVSGCVGFGIERWILVFLAQYGTDSACWPDEVKKFIRQKG